MTHERCSIASEYLMHAHQTITFNSEFLKQMRHFVSACGRRRTELWFYLLLSELLDQTLPTSAFRTTIDGCKQNIYCVSCLRYGVNSQHMGSIFTESLEMAYMGCIRDGGMEGSVTLTTLTPVPPTPSTSCQMKCVDDSSDSP